MNWQKWALASAALLSLYPATALADSCASEEYDVSAEANDVQICVSTASTRACPDNGLLRQNVDTGEVVKITACDSSGCFLDPCVGAGTYRYGLATPLACVRCALSTDYYGTFTTSGVGSSCSSLVEPADAVPWTSSKTICTYASSHASSGCSSSGAAVLGLNGLVAALGALLWRRRPRRVRQ